MAIRVLGRPMQPSLHYSNHCTQPTRIRDRTSHSYIPQKRSYSGAKHSFPFPVGMPSQPVMPGDPHFKHFEWNAQNRLSGKTTLTFDELRRLERENNASFQHLIKEIEKLNNNFDKLFNLMNISDKKIPSSN